MFFSIVKPINMLIKTSLAVIQIYPVSIVKMEYVSTWLFTSWSLQAAH